MRANAANADGGSKIREKWCGGLTFISMPAFARVVIPGLAYHVTQRGNYRQEIFTTDEDREIYLDYVVTAAGAYGLELHGWCLMANHVHWIVLPQQQMAMAQAFRRAHSRFASHINRQRKLAAGHLWQGRYYSCPLDEKHFPAALRYVERNPLRAGLVRSSAEYRWSSAPARLGLVSAPDYLQTYLWAASFTSQEWARLLDAGSATDDEERLRASTKQGKPCGDSAFIEQIEAAAGRELRVRAPGRPGLRRTGSEH